jgi:hypothetical protein
MTAFGTMWRGTPSLEGSLRFRLLLASITSTPLSTSLVVLIAVGVTAFVASRRTTGEFQRYVERRNPMLVLSLSKQRKGVSPSSWQGCTAQTRILY